MPAVLYMELVVHVPIYEKLTTSPVAHNLPQFDVREHMVMVVK